MISVQREIKYTRTHWKKELENNVKWNHLREKLIWKSLFSKGSEINMIFDMIVDFKIYIYIPNRNIAPIITEEMLSNY